MVNESRAVRKVTEPALKSKSNRDDIQDLIQAILDSPIKKSATVKVDGLRDISAFKGANTDVKTRILLQITMDAMKGDRASAEFLMKYGGFEPIKEAKVTVNTPTFLDDIPGDGLDALPEGEVTEALEAPEEELPLYVDPVEAGQSDQ